jgi:hypothetical protein
LLTAGHRSKLQNSRFFPKFSEAGKNPKSKLMKVGWQTGNGANFSLFGSAEGFV